MGKLKEFLKINKKLVYDKGKNITILQIIGFFLMLGSVLYLIIKAHYPPINSSIMAIHFFVIMLGIAFLYPSLLEGTEGISTMRMVVFMMTNVICLLLLKIGWADNIVSLEQIKLDQYWVGIIAFTFGAKATQSFFESNMAKNKEGTGMAGVTFNNEELARLAVQQNETFLKAKFPNILSVSDSVHDPNVPDSHIITLYLSDNNTADIPKELQIKMPDGTIKTTPTEIVTGLGTPTIHFSNMDKVEGIDTYCKGSVCCLIKAEDDDDFIGLITSGHVCSGGKVQNLGSAVPHTAVTINDVNSGYWITQAIAENLDMAVVKLLSKPEDNQCISFAGKPPLDVTNKNVKNTPVKLRGFKSKEKSGYILDTNIGLTLPYPRGGSVYMSKIILVGDNKDRERSTTLSQEGDSGGCVYAENGQLVGIVLGGDKKFTYVLSLNQFLNDWNYTLM